MDAEWLAGPAPRPTRFGEAPRFREGLHRVAEGAYAWMVPNGSWGETNLGLIDCGHESVLIDTGWDPHCTRALLDGAGPVLERAPIAHVVNTHADGDHCWGNQLFRDRHIVASEACIRQMGHLHPRALSALKAGCSVLRHVPLSGLAGFGHYMHTMLAPYRFSDVRLTPANDGFRGRREWRIGDVELVLLELGPGHTDGDIVVHWPARRLVYAADLLFVGATPVAWAGPVENVVRGLRALLALDAEVFVPGHGPLARRADVVALVDYWERVREALHPCFARGLTPAEAAFAVATSASFASQSFARWDSPERLMTNAFTLYREWAAVERCARAPRPIPTEGGAAPRSKASDLVVLRHRARLAMAMPEASPRVMHRPPRALSGTRGGR
jgi:glyoxylase-like metal-dependent hydrolase (beta-lactamase superfamily II)